MFTAGFVLTHFPQNNGETPEFYDDDIPLLYLGADTPALYYDAENDAPLKSYFGLLASIGLKSPHDGLKRSARHAMNLLAYLLLDWKDGHNNDNSDGLNLFARAFLSLPVSAYQQHMEFNLHIAGDDRGGAKEDACRIVVLVLTKHLDPTGEIPQPLLLEEVVTQPVAQQAFDVWSATAATLTTQQQELIQKNTVTRQAELDRLQRQEALLKNKSDDFDVDDPDASEQQDHTETENDDDESDSSHLDTDLPTIRKRAKKVKHARQAVRWADSQVAREQALRRADIQGQRRQSQDEAQELAEREREKQKALSKDPLTDEPVDLLQAESKLSEQIELALTENQEEVQKQESAGLEEMTQKALLQKESLEQMVEKFGGLEGLEHATKASVLPTNSKFNPLLFLTLLHRKTPYKDLNASMDNLLSKTENQAEQLQNLVRDNFPLFVKCAEGFEEFRTSSEVQVGMGVSERIETLESIAESAAFQAKKSFKPLLDNTSEIRKVQSALSVLTRVAPILQVPALMRQHIENRRYSQALKTYRRALVIDETCNMSLLNHVKQQAEDCVRDARRDLENRIAQDNASVEDLLDGIRDLHELLDLDIPMLQEDSKEEGLRKIGETEIQIRDHPPAIACLLLQAVHLSAAVSNLISIAEESTEKIFSSASTGGNQWKYDVLDARVLATIRAVSIAKVWLPRLVDVAKASFEDEKRRAAKIGRQRKKPSLSAFEVFVANIAPSVASIVEHASFCSLGSNTRTGAKYVEMTFGQDSDDKLRTLLRSPLPPSQSNKVGKELAGLVSLLHECSADIDALRPDSSLVNVSALEEAISLGDSALITIEKRRSIYMFDQVARACSNRASGSGKLDADALLNCLQNLAEQLSRPEECSNEVDKGCELVIRRCCEGLASYVRDRGEDARLNAVAECSDVLQERVDEIVREASYLSENSENLKEIITEDIVGLESAMFDEYLESIRLHVASSVRVGWLDKDNGDAEEDSASFPSYLSASLLSIVRCRAQVEQSLGNRIRKTDKVSYQHLSMVTVADGVVEGICNEILKRKLKLKVRQADRLANELEFLKNSLIKFLGPESVSLLDSTLNMVSVKAGRGRDYQGNGPDGLAALEELERLGRVYVLCLGGDA